MPGLGPDLEKYERGDPDYLGGTFQTDRPIGMWNCRHIAFNFLLGISEPSFSKSELERLERQNEEGIQFHGKDYSLYEAEQEQRRLETAMRRERERGILYKQVSEVDDIFKSDYQKSRERSKALRAEYQELAEVLKPKAMRAKWERASLPRREFINEIPGTDVTKKDLMKSAYEPVNRSHVSEAGRAFQKHTDGKDRSGIFYGNQTGKATTNTMQGAYFIDKILNSNNSEHKFTQWNDNGKMIDVIIYRLPDGMGAMWSADGKRFIGFRE